MRCALAASIVILLCAAPQADAAYTHALDGSVLTVTGDGASDTLLVSTDGVTLSFDVGGDGTDFAVPLASVTAASIDAGGGDDTVSVGNGTAAANISINGADGNDTIIGGDGSAPLIGGSGDDTITPGRGNDVVSGGAGDDHVVWNPGDGSDTIDGGDGQDSLRFNGANINENFAVAASGTRVHLTRDVATITMDLGTLEDITISTLGGTNTFTGGTGLSGLHVTVIGSTTVDTLNGGDEQDTFDPGTGGGDTVNGGAGDDTLIAEPGGDTLNGGPGDDRFDVSPATLGADVLDGGDGAGDRLVLAGDSRAETVAVTGAPAAWTVTDDASLAAQPIANAEIVEYHGLGGDDRLGLAASVLDALTVDADGGDGNDVLSGGNGADVLRGGAGDDALSGLGGSDQLFGDAGRDTLDGGAGADAVHCGGVGDTIAADAADTLDADCSAPVTPAPQTVTVTAPAVQTPAPVTRDTTAPTVTLSKLAARLTRKALATTGVSADIAVSEAAGLSIALVGRLRGATIARAGDVTLAERSFGASTARRHVVLRPAASLARRLARRGTVQLRVTATDAAGNRRTATRTISFH